VDSDGAAVVTHASVALRSTSPGQGSPRAESSLGPKLADVGQPDSATCWLPEGVQLIKEQVDGLPKGWATGVKTTQSGKKRHCFLSPEPDRRIFWEHRHVRWFLQEAEAAAAGLSQDMAPESTSPSAEQAKTADVAAPAPLPRDAESSDPNDSLITPEKLSRPREPQHEVAHNGEDKAGVCASPPRVCPQEVWCSQESVERSPIRDCLATPVKAARPGEVELKPQEAVAGSDDGKELEAATVGAARGAEEALKAEAGCSGERLGSLESFGCSAPLAKECS